MTPETDRSQQSLAVAQRVALAMPVSLFEVPSLFDLPRRVHRKVELPVEPPVAETRRCQVVVRRAG